MSTFNVHRGEEANGGLVHNYVSIFIIPIIVIGGGGGGDGGRKPGKFSHVMCAATTSSRVCNTIYMATWDVKRRTDLSMRKVQLVHKI